MDSSTNTEGDSLEWLHGIDPAIDWRRGRFGWAARLYTIASSILGEALGFGAVWKWVDWKAAIFVVIAGIATTFALLLWRHHLIAGCKTGKALHEVAHTIRDRAADVAEAMASGDVARYLDRFKRFNFDVADKIARYFQTLADCDSINCTIRLAAAVDGAECYITVGRSSGMATSREAMSEPVPFHEGVPGFLRKYKHSFGVARITDIAKAKRAGVWHPTKSDDLDDVKCLLITPINVKHNGERSMIGLLSATAKRKGDLSSLIVEPLKAFADLLASVYPLTIAQFAADAKEARDEQRSTIGSGGGRG